MAFILAGAFYLLLIDTTSSPELYAGLGATLLAAIAATGARSAGLRGARVRPRWVISGWRAVVRVPGDVFWVSLAALAQLVRPRAARGDLCAIPFAYGRADDPGDMGRRALAEAVGSLTPNTLVIGIDEERQLILVHQLRRTGADGIDVLGLG